MIPPLSTAMDGEYTIEGIPGSSVNQILSKLGGEKNRYFCSITSLNKPGSDVKYRHKGTYHYFPEIDKRTIYESKTKVWSFVYQERSSSRNKTGWNLDAHENVVRVAVCNLPDVEGIEEQIQQQLPDFHPDSWVGTMSTSPDIEVHATQLKNEKLVLPEFYTMSDCGFYCATVWITVTTQNVDVISIFIECAPNSWIYTCEPMDGGGPGLPYNPDEGEGCPDVTMPCYYGPSGPMDACQWMLDALPWVCDRCDTDDPIIDDIDVQQEMYDAWLDSYGPDGVPFDQQDRVEKLIIVTASSSGYVFEEIIPDAASSCHMTIGSGLTSVPTKPGPRTWGYDRPLLPC